MSATRLEARGRGRGTPGYARDARRFGVRALAGAIPASALDCLAPLRTAAIA